MTQPFIPRQYQLDACGAALDAFAAGKPACIVSTPTGTGKNLIAALVAQTCLPSGRVLFIAHRKELIEQSAATMRRELGVDTSTIIAGVVTNVGAPVLCAMVQSLTKKRLATLVAQESIDLIIIDEAHRAALGTQYESVLNAVRTAHPNAKALGLTATPFRTDKRRLRDLLGPTVFYRELGEMIAAGFVAPIVHEAVKLPIELREVRATRASSGRDYDPIALAKMMTGARGEIVTATAQRTAPLLAGRKAIVYAVNVVHAQALAAAYRAEGLRAEAAWGAMPSAARESMMTRFHSGDLDIVANAALYIEGLDIPACDAIVMCAPTMSAIKYLQCIGRASRLYPGKANALVIDVTGSNATPDERLVMLESVLPVFCGEGSDERPKSGPRKFVATPSDDRRLAWVRHDGERWTLTIDAVRRWTVYRLQNCSGLYGAFLARGRVIERELEPAPLPAIVDEIADAMTGEESKILALRNAAWRTVPASARQLAFIEKRDPQTALKARIENWNRGRASDEIERIKARPCIHYATADDATRAEFFARVDRRGGDNACHLWIGTFKLREKTPIFENRGVVKSARSVSMTLAGMTSPPKTFVFSVCGNERCVNHQHLVFKRTYTEKLSATNVAEIRRSEEPDRTLCERYGITQQTLRKIQPSPRSRRIYTSRITPTIAQIIRTSNDKPAMLAERFSVSRATIHLVRCGKGPYAKHVTSGQ